MENEGVTTHPTTPYLLAFAERLHAAGEAALAELVQRLAVERDEVRANRSGQSWHEVAAMLDTVIRSVEGELEARRPAA